MVVYVEELFINNFTLLLFVQYLICVLTNNKSNFWKILISSILGSVFYIYSLYLDDYGYVLLALLPFFNTALILRFYHIKDYLTSVFIFIAIYFAIIGSSAFIAYLYGMKAVNLLYLFGNVPFFVSVSFIIITFIICYIKKRLLSINNLNYNIVRAEMINCNYCCRTNAYYDTGNMVCTKNGEWVVIVSEYIYNKLMPAPQNEVTVATVASEYAMPVTPVLIKIYFEDGANKIYKVMAGRGKIDTDRYKIILHRDMR